MAEQLSTIAEIERGTSFVKQHPLWFLGLVPLGFAGLRIVFVSGGNTETLKSLVRDLDVPALALASILPLASSLAFWGLILAIITFSKDSGRRYQTNVMGLLFVAAITLPLIWFSMPLSYLLANVAAVFVFIFTAFAFSLTRRWPLVAKALVGLIALGSLTVLLYAPFALAGMWLPREQITVVGETPEFGFVLSSDERWTKFLDRQAHVHIVPTTSVTERRTIDNLNTWYHRTLSDLAS